ncbi:MAG TPA: phosphate ABC transporter substrate-binding protein PstS, partial [Candidatus Polarisedimenticolia bacterium]|nr:phosphate ABC transporter substrate-binding protein PstS [Candidatus Polarisedimenticolia bacterium]
MNKTLLAVLLLLALAVTAGAAPNGVFLNAAGATFPYPIYSKWFSDYHQHTGVQINYQSIGS